MLVDIHTQSEIVLRCHYKRLDRRKPRSLQLCDMRVRTFTLCVAALLGREPVPRPGFAPSHTATEIAATLRALYILLPVEVVAATVGTFPEGGTYPSTRWHFHEALRHQACAFAYAQPPI
jgi:hypothetical protein